MPGRLPTRLLALVSVGAALAGLPVVGEGRSQAQSKRANEVAKQEVKVKEVVVLRDAYVLMAMANHDYDGHRVKAMHQVEEAIKILDHSVLKHGTNGQKVVAHKEEIDTARAAFVAKHQGTLHESQAMSDHQMREAHKLLVDLHGAMAQHKQKNAVKHVDNAVKQIRVALKIR